MTISDLKRIYYAVRNRGFTKEQGFELLEYLVNEATQEKLGSLSRFHYEINAEEQRSNNGNAN